MTDQPTPLANDGEPTQEVTPFVTEEDINAELAAGDVDGDVDPDETEEEDTDFFGDEDEVVLPNPDEVITIQTSSGGKFYVVATEPITVSTVIAKSGLSVGIGSEVYLNGSKITMETLVPPAQTIMIIGSVKGGM